MQAYVDISVLSQRTELYPSVNDVILWIEALFRMVNEDYESRLLLLRAVSSYTASQCTELSTTWKLNDQLMNFVKGRMINHFKSSSVQVKDL